MLSQLVGTVGKPNIKVINTTDASVTLSLNHSKSIGDFPAVGFGIYVSNDNGTKVVFNKTSNEAAIFIVPVLPITNYTIEVYAYNQLNILSNSVKLNLITKGTTRFYILDKQLIKVIYGTNHLD